MHTHRGIKYRIYPTAEQEKQLSSYFAGLRFVRNEVLRVVSKNKADVEAEAARITAGSPTHAAWERAVAEYEAFPPKDQSNARKAASAAMKSALRDMMKAAKLKYDSTSLPALKAIAAKVYADHPWTKDVPCNYRDSSLADLEGAFKKFFKNPIHFKWPRLKKFGEVDAVRTGFGKFLPSQKGGEYKNVAIYKLNSKYAALRAPSFSGDNKIKIRTHRPIDGDPKFCTISHDAGKWFVSFLCQVEKQEETKAEKWVGIDRGITVALALSDGKLIQNGKAHRAELEKKRIRAQKAASRTKKGSRRSKIMAKKLASAAAKVANHRLHMNHVSTSRITSKYNVVVIEDLSTKNMTKSASGTVEKPGKNVNAKSGLNKSILNMGWYQMKTMLEYKVGIALIEVDPRHTSQKCSACGTTSKTHRKDQAHFLCDDCGNEMNADHNAAINILHRGMATVKAGGCSSAADWKARNDDADRMKREIRKETASEDAAASKSEPRFERDYTTEKALFFSRLRSVGCSRTRNGVLARR
jgi:putative transposase